MLSPWHPKSKRMDVLAPISRVGWSNSLGIAYYQQG